MKQISKYFVLILAAVIAFATAGSSFAQEQTDLLTVPSSIFGELENGQAVNSYFVEVSEAQVISMEVLALTEGYSASFAIYNSDGQALPIIADAMSGWGVDMKISLPAAGLYRILIGSLDNSFGSYLLRLNTIGDYSNNEYNLSLNTALEAEIQGNYEMHRYNFTARSNQSLTLYISSDIASPSLRISLVNQSQSQEVGAMDTPVAASSFCIPAGTDHYSLDLMSGAGMVEGSYSLLLLSSPSENCAQTLPLANATEAASNEVAANTTNDATASSPVVNNQDNAQESSDNNADNDGNTDTDNGGDNDNGGSDDDDNINDDTSDECATVEVDAEVLDVNTEACVDVEIGIGDTVEVDAELCADLSANLTEAQIQACLDLGLEIGDTVEADAEVDANVDLGDTVEVDAELCADLSANLTEAQIQACLDLGLEIGETVEADVDADADVDLGDTVEVDAELCADLTANLTEAQIQACLDLGLEIGETVEADVEVDANVDLGDTVEVDAELCADLTANLSEAQIQACLDLGLEIGDTVEADAEVDADVDLGATVEVDADLEVELGEEGLELETELDVNLDTNLNPVSDGTSCYASPAYLVNVRALPSTNSAIIATVDATSSVEVLAYILNSSWVQVKLLDGSTGYMSAGLLNIVTVCAMIELPTVSLTDLGIEEAVITVDAQAQAEAEVTVGADTNLDVEADAEVNLGTETEVDVELEADVETDVNLGTETEVDVDAELDVELGTEESPVNVDVNTDVDTNINLGTDDNAPELEVEAEVNLGNTGVNLDVEIKLPGLP